MATCKTCTHFEIAKPYRWGNCRAPIPFWLDNISTSMVNPEDGKDCDAYYPKDVKA